MEMFYTARQFPAQEAYEMGLLNRVLSDAELDAHVDEIAERISERRR